MVDLDAAINMEDPFGKDPVREAERSVLADEMAGFADQLKPELKILYHLLINYINQNGEAPSNRELLKEFRESDIRFRKCSLDFVKRCKMQLKNLLKSMIERQSDDQRSVSPGINPVANGFRSSEDDLIVMEDITDSIVEEEIWGTDLGFGIPPAH